VTAEKEEIIEGKFLRCFREHPMATITHMAVKTDGDKMIFSGDWRPMRSMCDALDEGDFLRIRYRQPWDWTVEKLKEPMPRFERWG